MGLSDFLSSCPAGVPISDSDLGLVGGVISSGRSERWQVGLARDGTAVLVGVGGRQFRVRRSLVLVVVAGLLAAAWMLVYAAGGTRTALPHLFYVPVVVAAVGFGPRGGLVSALIAGVVCGPLMPVDVVTGQAQSLSNWLARTGFFVAIGMLIAALSAALRHGFVRSLSTQVGRELATYSNMDGSETVGQADVARRVRRLLEGGGPRMVFQPIYSLADGRLIAAEALARFDTDSHVSPEVWFEQAASAGLGTELELAAVRAALDRSGQLPDRAMLTINLSPQTLVDSSLQGLLVNHITRPLVVELTEHVGVDDYQQLEAALGQLRRHSVRFAVDDAGAGFASLRHVVRLAPEYIKLDASLTQGLGFDPVRQALADALMQFAHRTNSMLIAEGIEHREDLASWQDLGAHAAQGYLLGQPGPLPVEEFSSIILDRPLAVG